jgi:hypothetical protein
MEVQQWGGALPAALRLTPDRFSARETRSNQEPMPRAGSNELAVPADVPGWVAGDERSGECPPVPAVELRVLRPETPPPPSGAQSGWVSSWRPSSDAHPDRTRFGFARAVVR